MSAARGSGYQDFSSSIRAASFESLSSALMRSLPVEDTFTPGVGETQAEDGHEHHRPGEPDGAELLDGHGPREEEDGFDVEQDEEDGDQVEVDRGALLRRT